jgi:predicted lipoprotein with Yx(FWY)xxD motif
MNSRMLHTVAVVVIAGLGLAACGHKASPSASGGSGQQSPSAGSATVEATSVSGLGTVLVNGSGLTLYLLTADKPNQPTCTSSPCTTTWHPLVLSGGGSPTGGMGAKSSLLGTAKTSMGSQVTYKGWPLYTYSGDSGAGQANGEGISSFGGTWYAVSTSGAPVKSSSGGGGGGYGGY